MIANGLMLLVFIAVGAAIGVWITRRSRRDKQPAAPQSPSLNQQYFAGLNFLLNEEPDKALEVFLRMVEVDNDTVETHLALGSLYRRRGEVDRAIRIHENIMARQSLPDEHREHAMFALGEDYFRAGLFDRAEQMFQRLSEQPGHSSALRYLLRIYEQQADWEQAIATYQRLQVLASPQHPTAIAHYYCELAEQARERGERDVTLELLRKVRGEQRNFARSALIRADVAWDMGDRALAARLCQRVVELHPQLLPLVLQRYVRVAQADGDAASAVQNFRPLVRPEPGARAELAAAGIVAGLESEPFVLECLPDFVRRDPNLGVLVPALVGDPSDLSNEQRLALSAALARILKRGQRYRCVECGLPTATHFWQCPGCRSWDTLAPASRLELTPVSRAH